MALTAAGVLFAAVTAAAPAQGPVDAAAGGAVDSFGSGGLVRMGLNVGRSAETLAAVRVEDGGRVVAAGTVDTGERRAVWVSRRDGNGAPDMTFGAGGTVEIDQGPDVETVSVAGLGSVSGGVVLVVNVVLQGGTYRNRFVRLGPDGVVDPGSSDGGTGGGLWAGHRVEQAAIDASGRVIVAGTRGDGSLFVSRAGTDGNLDEHFGTGGYAIVAGVGGLDGIEVRDLEVGTSGAVTVCGHARRIEDRSDVDGLVVRLDGSGALEGGFGSGGVVVLDGPGYDSVGSCSVDAAERVVLAVATGTSEVETTVLVQRRSGSSGAVDPGFGAEGSTNLPLGSIVAPTGSEPYADARAVSILHDGRIAVAGSVMDATTSGFNEYLALLEETGTPDPGFGTSGAVRLDATAASGAVVAALDRTDGGLIVGSWRYGTRQDGYLSKIAIDGSLDSTFGQGGRVLFDLSEAQLDDRAASIDVDAEGRTVVLGTWSDGESSALRVLRLGTDGKLDAGFGTGGSITVADPPGERLAPSTIRVDTNGRLTVLANGTTGIRVLRLLANGELDPGFGTGGMATLQGTSASFLTTMSLLGDGRVAVVHFEVTGGDATQYLSVLGEQGEVDTRFGGTGRVRVPSTMWVSDMVGHDSRILVVGHSTTGALRRPMLAEFSPDGSMSGSFGKDGMVVETSGAPSQSRSISSVALDHAGGILTGGTSPEGGFLARFSVAGELMAGFGANGYSVLGSVGDVVDLGLTTKGEILVSDGWQVLRLRRDGVLDPDFGDSGSRSIEPVVAGEMRVTGYTASIGGWVQNGYNADIAVLRIDATSTPDAPTDPRADAGPGTLEVSWVAGIDGGANVRYTVDTQPESPGCETALTGCTLRALSPGQRYLVRVRAVNRNGTSSPAEVWVTVPAGETGGSPGGGDSGSVPEPGVGDAPASGGGTASGTAGPSRVRVTAVDRGLLVRFDKVLGARRHVATTSPGNGRCTAVAPNSSCEIRGLRPWVSYTVHVVAEGDWGTSRRSPAVTARPVRHLARGASVALSAITGVQGPGTIWSVRGACRIDPSRRLLVAPRVRTTCKVVGRQKRRSVNVTVIVP